MNVLFSFLSFFLMGSLLTLGVIRGVSGDVVYNHYIWLNLILLIFSVICVIGTQKDDDDINIKYQIYSKPPKSDNGLEYPEVLQRGLLAALVLLCILLVLVIPVVLLELSARL